MGRTAGGLLLASIAAAPPLLYAGYITIITNGPLLTSAYWQGTMGNWLATIIGVVAGLPIALWLNKAIQRVAESRTAAEATAKAAERAERVREVLLKELGDNVPGLEDLTTGTITRIHFSTARWNAMAAGGELRWVTEVDLLEQLALAYESIDVVNGLARIWIAYFAPSCQTPRSDNNTDVSTVIELLIGAGVDALDQTKNAIISLSGSTT